MIRNSGEQEGSAKMARPREFDPDVAVEGAMQIFWRRGYTATNLPDLLEAMGLTRGSFYKAFGNKRAVYIEALKRYGRNMIGKAVTMLETGPAGTGNERIKTLFRTAFGQLEAADERRGCLVCNAMVELAPSDPEVAKLTSEMYDRLQKAVERALRDDAGDRNNEFVQTGRRAALITNMYFGAQAISKTGQELPDWNELLNVIAVN